MARLHPPEISPFFQIPLELREEILSHLLQPQYVHTSSATPDTHSLHRHNKAAPTYVDTRIYVPSRMPNNILQVCKQLREETLAYHARRLNSSRHAIVVDPKSPNETTGHTLAERNNTGSDDMLERLHDDNMVRMTLEILRQHRGTMGYYTPERKELSPRFMGLKPLLCRLRKCKFTVWAGYDWWSGESTRPISKGERLDKARISRVSADQDDKATKPTIWLQGGARNTLESRPNPLSVAIDTLLQHLPLVEEVKIDLLIHDIDYWNWDLPETWWEGISDWLDRPISPLAKGRVKKIDRRLIVVYHGHARVSGTLLHQRELVQQDNTVIRVERGTRQVSGFNITNRHPDLLMLNVRSMKMIGRKPNKNFPSRTGSNVLFACQAHRLASWTTSGQMTEHRVFPPPPYDAWVTDHASTRASQWSTTKTRKDFLYTSLVF